MQPLRTERLVLQPLTAAHAPAMFAVLQDPQIYRFIEDRPPPSVEHLARVYAALERRTSPAGDERWLNWVVCDAQGQALGYVQATVQPGRQTWVAYVFASLAWGRGHAFEAVKAMMDHLAACEDVPRFAATVEAGNLRSVRLLLRLGFREAAPARADELSAGERRYVLERTR